MIQLVYSAHSSRCGWWK